MLSRLEPSDHLPLAQLLPESGSRAAEQGRGTAVLNRVRHRAVFNAALDGAFPAERINGRRRVRRADLPRIAELLEAAGRHASRSHEHGNSSLNAAVSA